MGDVIMTLPVLKGVLTANSNVEIYLLTRKYLFPFFEGIENLHLIEADLKNRHKGIKGLYRLFKEIRTEIKPDRVIDLHQVLRTYLLNIFFRISFTKVISFNKGSAEKKEQVRKKSRKQLPDTITRYREAFEKAGFKVTLPDAPVLQQKTDKVFFEENFGVITDNNTKLIGIAPFAQHKQKIWGEKKVEKLITLIQENFNAKIFLFGGGKKEMDKLREIKEKFKNIFVSADFYTLDKEIGLIGALDLMVSMDSANMHIAALTGIPTISVWGGTHSSLGFAPYQQDKKNMIEYNGPKLTCRPCSVYGNKKCIYNTVKCMDYISENQVFQRISKILKNE